MRITGIADNAENVRYYAIDVPTGATGLTVVISGGTQDADLHVHRFRNRSLPDPTNAPRAASPPARM